MANKIVICGYEFNIRNLQLCGVHCNGDFVDISKLNPPRLTCHHCKSGKDLFTYDMCRDCIIRDIEKHGDQVNDQGLISIRQRMPPGIKCCHCFKQKQLFVDNLCQECVIRIHQSINLIIVANKLELLFGQYQCHYCKQQIETVLDQDILHYFKPNKVFYTDWENNVEDIEIKYPKWTQFPVIHTR